ncbi:nucleoside 2-deoxyribosyltransferase domain-containing protein [Novosphingobium terrae]|uniref:nucleoside 2-deoxyribosyltransferase domain-containing protein n=1 Tax=Novosphingobium terrae TaxID=2726189 RepID=UPI001981246E|nr:nucleoside 2-deoxyribosyltransferase domain-containing protein [Novosphingobium terrae]
MIRKPILPAVALAAAALNGTSAQAETAEHRSIVITSPEPLPAAHHRLRVFLGGSIDMGHAPDWQKDMIAALAQDDVEILNPRRPDWNPAWRPEANEPEFRKQVEWELSALESADVIVLYLAPGSQSPISLLEMGLHARSGKLIVLCPQGFWRKGNVDITAERYGVQQVADLPALTRAVKEKLAALRRR